MKQNNYFSPMRFARLLRNDWLINQKIYLFTAIGAIIVVYAISYLFMMNKLHFNHNNYIPLFVFFMIGVGVFIGSAFPVLKDSIKTTNYLLAPGSTFEKFMVQFVIRVVIAVPLALILFWIAVYMVKATLIPDPISGFDPAVHIPYFHYKELFNGLYYTDVAAFLIGIFSYYTFLFTGSVYFNRYALVKTLITTALIVFALFCSFVLFSHIFYSAETHGFEIKLKTYNITEGIDNIKIFLYALASFSWLFFLPLAYFKLKEKEV